MRLAIWILAILSPLAASQTLSNKNVVPVSVTFPSSPPSALISNWKEENGRKLVMVERDDAILRGWEYRGKNSALPCVLFFYGSAMKLEAADPLLREIASKGPDVVAFDYRGYGFSSGKADMMKMREDALQLFDSQSSRKDLHNGVVVMGYSMGTNIAAYVAANRKTAGLILVSPMASAAEILPIYLRLLGTPADIVKNSIPSNDMVAALDVAKLTAQSTAPLMIVHSDADEIHPLTQGREVYDASKSKKKRFVLLTKFSHNQMFYSERTYDEIESFVESLE